MSPASSFRDPGFDGAGLTMVAEQCSLLGGMERVAAVVLDRWPATEVVSGRFLADPGPTLFPTARHVDLPGSRVHHLAPLHGRRLRRAAAPDGEIVLALHSSGWALAPRFAPGVPVVAYTNGVPRWLGPAAPDYVRERRWPIRAAARATAPLQRAHQRRLRERADVLLAPSRAAAATLTQPVRLVHAPVATAAFAGEGDPEGHVIAVARLVAHKRLDLLVEAMRGRPERLVIVGTGPQRGHLGRLAPANVTFAGRVGDDELAELLHGARALVAPASEEFGIAMAEAHAAGVPVIAPRAGGAIDIVSDPRTGRLLDDVTPATIAAALDDVPFDPAACRASAARFDEERFVEQLGEIFDTLLGLKAPLSLAV